MTGKRKREWESTVKTTRSTERTTTENSPYSKTNGT